MITATDLFCGAGGSSLGAEMTGKVKIAVAANHWQTAIDVHQPHFPDARHDVADISQADPRRYPATDILLASPECTNHSQAKGVSRSKQDPSTFDSADLAAERSRATMWDVIRFAEQIPYKAIIVENVVEATKWRLWPAWTAGMESLGYELTLNSVNSMHHNVPQSRDRLYIVATRKGINFDLEREDLANCPKCECISICRQTWKNGNTVGRYRTQWVWTCTTCSTIVEPEFRPASSIIDWGLDCPRIGDRTKALSPATMRRIEAGLRKFGYLEPIITAGAGNVHERTPGNRARSLDDVLAVQQASATHAMAVPPFLMNTWHGGRTTGLDQPHPTVCAADDRQSLIVPIRNHGNSYPVSDPLGAVTAGGNHHGLLMRNNRGGAEMVTSADDVARTMTTKGSQSLLMPYYGNGTCSSIDRPHPTVRTHDGSALIDHAQAVVDDCGFRMLQPHEIAAAMAFPEGYIPNTLTKKDQVKLAGNAVTPPVMQHIVGRVIQALETA